MSFLGMTFAGADESAAPRALAQVVSLYFPIEWGIRFALPGSGDPAPSLPWIRQLPPNLNYCAILEGQLAADFVEGDDTSLRDRYDSVLPLFGRVQVNPPHFPPNFCALKSRWTGYADKQLTVAVPGEGSSFLEELAASAGPCSVLFRPGEKIEGQEWPKADRRFLGCGYGGTLGPENVYRHAPALVKAAKQARFWWIEMEEAVRRWRGQKSSFHPESCQKAITEVDNYFMHYVI